MADKKIETKIEREYVIPLREKCRPVPRYKKTNKAVKSVKEFLVKHMQIRDRDLNKIKIDRYLNEALWFRGIRSPPSKIKVKAIKEGDLVKVELVEMIDKFKFSKLREEKREQKAMAIAESKKKTLEKMKEAATKPVEKTAPEVEGKEKKEEEKEKKAAVVEAGAKMEKEAAKKIKHQVGGKTKEPKRPKRMALSK